MQIDTGHFTKEWTHSLFNGFAKILSNILEFISYLLITAFPVSIAQHFVNLRNKNRWSENINQYLKLAHLHVREQILD